MIILFMLKMCKCGHMKKNYDAGRGHQVHQKFELHNQSTTLHHRKIYFLITPHMRRYEVNKFNLRTLCDIQRCFAIYFLTRDGKLNKILGIASFLRTSTKNASILTLNCAFQSSKLAILNKSSLVNNSNTEIQQHRKKCFYRYLCIS